MRPLCGLDDVVARLHASLDRLDRAVTRLKWAIYGWGLVLTAEVLLLTGLVWWWDR
jgi:hypothetical protein